MDVNELGAGKGTCTVFEEEWEKVSRSSVHGWWVEGDEEEEGVGLLKKCNRLVFLSLIPLKRNTVADLKTFGSSSRRDQGSGSNSAASAKATEQDNKERKNELVKHAAFGQSLTLNINTDTNLGNS